jgi:putative flippase GtrA
MRIVRYFVVGGTAALVDWILFYVLAVQLSINFLVAGGISFTIATIVNYFLSVAHVFESGARFQRRHEILAVFVVSGIGLAINQAILFVLVQWISLHLMASKITATGVVFLWNYFARSRYVFRPSPNISELR